MYGMAAAGPQRRPTAWWQVTKFSQQEPVVLHRVFAAPTVASPVDRLRWTGGLEPGIDRWSKIPSGRRRP